jgi:hypothetical protein
MAIFTVTTANDVVNAGDGVLSLREAVAQSNITTTVDTIQFATATLEGEALVLRYRGADLAYRTFDKLRRVDQAAIVENKRLGAVLAVIRDRQDATARWRNHDAPSRSFQPVHMFPE